jgi:HK97 family phage prohead protease
MEKKQRVLDAYSKVETRKEAGKMYIDGMIPYNSRSEEMWGFVEQIAPGAFKRTLGVGKDIFAFWAHDSSKVLGSNRAGTLAFEDKTDGLHFSVELRENEVSKDYFEAVERGDVTGVSFGFYAEREEWDNTQEPAVRTLKEINLLEVSPGVAFPAYPGAQSEAARRSLYDEGAPEFRTIHMKAPQDTPPPPESTDDPQPEAREALAARQGAELSLVCAQYGIQLQGEPQ